MYQCFFPLLSEIATDSFHEFAQLNSLAVWLQLSASLSDVRSIRNKRRWMMDGCVKCPKRSGGIVLSQVCFLYSWEILGCLVLGSVCHCQYCCAFCFFLGILMTYLWGVNIQRVEMWRYFRLIDFDTVTWGGHATFGPNANFPLWPFWKCFISFGIKLCLILFFCLA